MTRTSGPDLLRDQGAIAAYDVRGSWRRSAILGLTIAGALLGGLSLLPLSPALVWNATERAPIGLYRIDHHPPSRGDLVVVAPAGEAGALLRTNGGLAPGRMLLKPLAGVAGDVICRFGSVVSVNGRVIAKALARAHARL